MTDFQINSDILSKICGILDGLSTSNNEVLTQIYRTFEIIHSHEPLFCFYLLHIIKSDQFSMQRRIFAMAILHKNFMRIQREYIPFFIQISKPLLEEIIILPFSPFTSIAASILCTMVKLFGSDNFPDFFDRISVLFTKENTIQIGLECLREMVCNNQPIPEQFLQIIIELIGSPFTKQIFDICEGICNQNIQYIHDFLLPTILTQFSNFNIPLLCQACNITAKSYLELPDDVTGDFLAQALSTKEISICESILIELNEIRFPPYPPLILSLLNLLETPDEDITKFAPCSMSQQLIFELTQCYTDEMIEIVNSYLHTRFPNIYQQSLDSTNVGHFLRCLYTILSESYFTDTPESQFYLALITSLFTSPFRGDACMCLMSLCFSNPSLLNDSFAQIIQLLHDEDPGVQFQARLSLMELVEFSNLEVSPELFFFLFELAKQTDDIENWSLASRYLVHFDRLGTNEPNMYGFYQSLVQVFIELTVKPNYFLIDILSSLIRIISEPFHTINKQLLIFLLYQITSDDFDENYFRSYLELLKSILDVYSTDISNEIIEEGNTDMLFFIQTLQFRLIMIITQEEIMSSHLLKDVYETLYDLLNIIPDVSNDQITQEILDSLFELSLNKMNHILRKDKLSELSIQFLSFISSDLSKFVIRMNQPYLEGFITKCYELISKFMPTGITDENKKDEKDPNLIQSHEEQNPPVLLVTLISNLKNFAMTIIALLEGNGVVQQPEVKSYFT